jgi:hypothetical protein
MDNGYNKTQLIIDSPLTSEAIEKFLFGDAKPLNKFDEASRHAFLTTVKTLLQDGGKLQRL